MVNKVFKCLKTNWLTIATVFGVIWGFIIGLILRFTIDYKFNQREIIYIGLIGDLFLRMLKALILPLIISSLVSAVGSLDVSAAKKLGYRAVSYYIITTFLAVFLGIILVYFIRPGVSDNNINNTFNNEARNSTTVDTLLDLLRNMLPPNLIQACTHQYRTTLEFSNGINITDVYTWKVSGEYVDGTNILGLVIFSIIFGSAISSLGSNADAILAVVVQTSQVTMKITNWVIAFSPIGVFFLICAKIIELDDLGSLGGKIGMYFATVCVGLFFHGFVVLPILFLIFTRNNPYKYLLNMTQSLTTAFGTASSSAALPVTIKDLETKNNITPTVVRFVVPIGSTINMDGTALYEAVATIFIAQTRGIVLNSANIIAISLTATMASIGAAGIPHAGLVTMVMVLDAVGLPIEDVSLIITVDWLLDRIRTAINVLGDAFGAGILDHYYKKEIKTKGEDQSFDLTETNM